MPCLRQRGICGSRDSRRETKEESLSSLRLCETYGWQGRLDDQRPSKPGSSSLRKTRGSTKRARWRRRALRCFSQVLRRVREQIGPSSSEDRRSTKGGSSSPGPAPNQRSECLGTGGNENRRSP